MVEQKAKEKVLRINQKRLVVLETSLEKEAIHPLKKQAREVNPMLSVYSVLMTTQRQNVPTGWMRNMTRENFGRWLCPENQIGDLTRSKLALECPYGRF